MEYLNLVKQILEAERSAKDIAREAQERKPVLEADLQKEIADIRTEAMERAKSRVAREETRIRAEAQAELDRRDRRQKEALTRVEDANQKYRENWVETLLSMIVKETT